ncbi:MAG: transporter related [Thermomicrobiales bacterium]|nr:transporter related [Thermomicrobiales bacterium]
MTIRDDNDAVPAVEMRGIVKRFPGVVANNGIEFAVRRGEIHALLGENGAGKSTLMNILFGLYHPDEGEIRVNGRPVRFESARDAVRAGLAMVHQHFMLIPRFTVTENVILGSEGAGIVLDREAAGKRVTDLADRYGFDVDPDAIVGDLPVGMQQRVEILRALYAISDRVTVIHRGRTVGTRETRETTASQLAEMMVGRAVSLRVERPPAHPGEPVLVAEDLQLQGSQGHAALNGVDLELRRGEILGICGVEGNGQAELIEVLSGLRRPQRGRVLLKGQDVTTTGPNRRRRLGLSYIPEDRHGRGLVLPFSLTENVLLGNAEETPFSSGGRIDYPRSRTLTERLMQAFDVRAPTPDTPAGALSGGNQQKLIIARELHREPDALLAVQPTRGLDVGAIEFVHKQLVAERDKGRGVLLISFDLDEVMDLSDRILVLCEGRIVGDFLNGTVTRTELGLLMGGRGLDEHAPAAD